MKRFSNNLLIGLVLLFSGNALAIECQVNLHYGIVIEPNHIRITDNYRTLLQINNDKQLFIEGREILLSIEQSSLLTQYSQDVRLKIPEVITLLNDGLEIRLKALDAIIGGLTGENSRSHQKIQSLLNDLQNRVTRRYFHSDDSYIIAPQDINEVEKLLTNEISDQIETMITSSLGSIFTAFENSNSAMESSNLEQRMVAFGKQLDIISGDMLFVSQSQAEELETTAFEFCSVLSTINETENQLHAKIPQLAKFDLLTIE